MPRRSILANTEREGLSALPDNQEDLVRRYYLSESDLSIIRHPIEELQIGLDLPSSFAT